MRNSKNKNFIRIAAVIICILFLASSAAQAVVKLNVDLSQTRQKNLTTLDDEYYTWEDTFENGQKIDMSLSDNYILNENENCVEMAGTYPEWDNSEWTRMKVISISSQEEIQECIIKLTIDYDTDMRSDYGDLRFKFNGDYIPYWIEEKNPQPNDPYAVVWAKVSMLPTGNSKMHLFYGNPSATDQGSYWSVFDQDSWNKYYVHDHRVTTHSEREGAWDPDVTWGDNKFFVSWEEGIPRYLPYGMIFKQQIRGCFYSEDGERIGTRFDISPWDSSPGVKFRCENPSTAYGESGSNKNFFVAYEEYNDPNDLLSRDIKGAIVPTTTNGIEDVSYFNICLSSGNQADPCVAYDPTNHRFFVVWEDGRQGTTNYNIYGQMFDLNGNPVGSEKTISNRPNSQCEPWITFDEVNNHYMVVWEEGIDPEEGPFDIWGQLFTTSGSPLGSAKLISPAGTDSTDYNFPCVAYCSLVERYLVTWQEDDISSDSWFGDIYGKILDENANAVGDKFRIARGNFERTNAVPHLSSSFFVVYDGNGDVWGSLVSSEGQTNPYTLQLSDGESDPADWANIASSGQKIYVAWEDERVVYPDPYEGLDLPDVYANVWSFNTPSSSDVNIVYNEEISLILDAHVTSDPIEPENWQNWFDFSAISDGNVKFDILDGNNPNNVLKSDISTGASIQDISESPIRLKATFSRDNPSTTPKLYSWAVRYVGLDDDPPLTSVDNINGEEGLSGWYISNSVTVTLVAQDFPPDTGSGIDETYYKLNGGQTQIYNEDSGIILEVTQEDSWTGQWAIEFWSVDRKGNVEETTNSLTIKIDADAPFLEITSPANEAIVEVPFWVYADATDNVGVVKVEFDIEPFGEREDMPYVDGQAPYEWYCDVEQVDDDTQKTADYHTTSVSIMIQATAHDAAGHTCRKDLWVTIDNWENNEVPSIIILLLQKLMELFPILTPLLQPLIELLS